MNNTKDTLLINPTAEPTDPTYPDFVSLLDFINRTGVFVSPCHFDLVYRRFQESGVSVDKFIQDYEARYADDVVSVPMSGTFKYEFTDDQISCLGEFKDEDHNATVLEALYSALDLAEYRRKKYQNMLEERKKIEEQTAASISAVLEDLKTVLKN